MATQSRIREIIIHYTATYEDDRSVTVAAIDGWHKARGWAGIGYHFVIYQDGTVHRGRELHVVGAHAPPNTGRVGICYVGGLKRSTGANVGHDTRTPQQVGAMIGLIQALHAGDFDSAKAKVDPGAPVIGHRDTPGASTQCPGFDAGAWWRQVRTGQPIPAPAPPPPDVPLPPVKTPGVHEDPAPAATGSSIDAGAGAAGAAGAAAAAAAGEWWLAGLIVAGVALFIAIRFLRRRKP